MMDRLVKVVCQLNLEFQDVVLVINFYSIKDGDHLAAVFLINESAFAR